MLIYLPFRCIVCKLAAKTDGKTLDMKINDDGDPGDSQPVGIVRRFDGNTRGMISHYQSKHLELLPELAKNREYQEKKKDENKRKRKEFDE